MTVSLTVVVTFTVVDVPVGTINVVELNAVVKLALVVAVDVTLILDGIVVLVVVFKGTVKLALVVVVCGTDSVVVFAGTVVEMLEVVLTAGVDDTVSVVLAGTVVET